MYPPEHSVDMCGLVIELWTYIGSNIQSFFCILHDFMFHLFKSCTPLILYPSDEVLSIRYYSMLFTIMQNEDMFGKLWYI